MEDEMEERATRSEKLRNENADELESKYIGEMRENEEGLQNTVEELRENHDEAIQKQREMAKQDVVRLKSQMYDHRGKADQAVILRDELKQAQESWEAEKAGMDKRNEKSSDYYENKITNLSEEHEKDLEAKATKIQQASGQTNKDIIAKHEEINERRKKLEKQFYEMNEARTKEVNEERKYLNTELEKTQNAYESKKNKLARQSEQAMENFIRGVDHETKEIISTQKDAYGRDRQELQNKLNELSFVSVPYVKEKGEGRQEAIRDMEQEWRQREKHVNQAYKEEKDGLRRQITNSQNYSSMKNLEELANKDKFYNKLLKDEKADDYYQQESLHKMWRDDRDNLNAKNKSDNELSERRISKTLQNAKEDAARNYGSLAERSNQTMKDQKALSDAHIGALKTQLGEFRDKAGEDNNIEDRMRNGLIKNYEKTLAAEKDKNEKNSEQIKQSYSGRLMNVQQKAMREKTQVHKDAVATIQEEREKFIESFSDTRAAKEDTMIRLKDQHERELDNVSKNFTRVMEKQRDHYDDLLGSMRNETRDEIASVRREGDFKLKMAYRDYAMNTGASVRKYEKKISDLRDTYEVTLNQTKEEMESKLREQNKAHQRELEAQSKGYEFQLAQLEQSNKENMATLTENYNEQLDDVRRASSKRKA